MVGESGAGENGGCGDAESDCNVRSLQACLFPPQFTPCTSYFSNFSIKVQPDDRFKAIESFSAKESFPALKDAAFILQPPRWPTECQVLEEQIRHVNYIPPGAEPYYQVTGDECQPKPSGEECGVLVYQYCPIGAVNYFSRSSVGGSRYLLSSNLCAEDDSLRFESRFESGNLARAIRITENYYELHLRSDLYTNRHMQWFYFRVSNTKRNFLYRISITNCSKEDSLYNEGMKPLMYSKKDAQLHSIGWRRCGQNITYFCNDNVSPEDQDQLQTYTLTFTVTFPHDDDEVYLAHCYPYTYSDLQDHLAEIRAHPIKQNFSTVRLLCRSLAGNDVYFVTVTSPPIPGDNKKKRAVVITGRVHPGETPSSWIMKGILDFLTGDTDAAKMLRDKFIFKIIPMLNPDGVIVGNNRCSLAAKDLNRQYRTVMRDAYPSVWYTKLMVRSDGGESCSSSDEVGHEEAVPPQPPPPSPAATKRQYKPKSSSSVPKPKMAAKSPGAPRKPLPICKAVLKLSLSENEDYGTSSDEEAAEKNRSNQDKVKMFRRRRRKRKPIKKRWQSQNDRDHSDSEIQCSKSIATRLAVFDLIVPDDKMPGEGVIPQPRKATPRKLLAEKKSEITKQLSEVQAKLYTLKNKLWFGTGNTAGPISWGCSQFCFSTIRSSSEQKTNVKKVLRKIANKANKPNQEAKSKSDHKEKDGKNQNGLKRQIVSEWPKIRKSKSLPDNSTYFADKPTSAVDRDSKYADKSKKKKRKGKFAKKAKAVGNAKVFLT
ncbi:cytosolic carboxypeptidase 2-like isoform X3 [Cylas formicarius]|uniref:cytosolic carboxypeptidase 2-like isoform X3 n=1 Tax=Cylas formicarius TaxID=197179 RepID=UPI002958D4C9|nr:cytosolic carboxypeptidase 2-like isoform X3 [Cylas formicarius]